MTIPPESHAGKVGYAVAVLCGLSDEQRVEVFATFCRHCGSDNPCCQCWNDE